MTTEATVRTPEMDLKIRTAARKFPDWWIETILGGQLWRMQKAIAQATFYYPRVTVRSCESAGKTYMAARVALAFLYNYPPATVITTGPTNRQVEDILWREIRLAVSQSKMALEGNVTRKAIDITENWFAVGFATDEPERMLGYHNVNVLVIGDDAAGLTNDIYGAIENPLSTGNTHLLLISNPTQSVGAFRDTFNSDLYKKYHISAFDTPNLAVFGITQEDIESGEWLRKWNGRDLPYPQLISPQKVHERFKEWGKGSYLYTVFILGDFPEAGVDNLCKLSDVEFAMSRQLLPETYDKALKVAALDVARYGDDSSVFAVRQGNKVLDIVEWGHKDSTYTQGRAARLIKEHKPIRTYVDVVGLGAGIYDNLKKEIGGEHKLMEFDSGKPALDTERYLNRRAEGYWEFNQKLADKELELPNNIKLKAQLADIRYTYNTKGLLQIESKEEAKARGSKSPDIADAVMMTFGKKKGGGTVPVWRY